MGGRDEGRRINFTRFIVGPLLLLFVWRHRKVLFFVLLLTIIGSVFVFVLGDVVSVDHPHTDSRRRYLTDGQRLSVACFNAEQQKNYRQNLVRGSRLYANARRINKTICTWHVCEEKSIVRIVGNRKKNSIYSMPSHAMALMEGIMENFWTKEKANERRHLHIATVRAVRRSCTQLTQSERILFEVFFFRFHFPFLFVDKSKYQTVDSVFVL